jgi:hypothetical protein
VDELTRRPSLRFGPDPRLTAVWGIAGVATAVAAVLTGDRGARLLWGAAALVLIAYAVTDLVFSPRLAADGEGLRVRSPLVRASFSWRDVDDVRADVANRHGLRSVTLEIDSGDVLIVLSRRALGADPEDVAALVRTFDPRRTP